MGPHYLGSKMAAEKISRISPCYECSAPGRYTRVSLEQPASNRVQAVRRANSILYNWLVLAHRAYNELPHKNAVWAHIISVAKWLPRKPLALAHVMNILPLADTLELA